VAALQQDFNIGWSNTLQDELKQFAKYSWSTMLSGAVFALTTVTLMISTENLEETVKKKKLKPWAVLLLA
jgi:hypothetical protein